MIVSVHIPKTAGRSFRTGLEAAFGSRVLFDYRDAVGINTPQAHTRRALNMAETRARREELLSNYDVVHGHFIADKYAGLFPSTSFSAFFRDPYQQIFSLYHFFKRTPGAPGIHPGASLFRKIQPTILEFIEAVPNVQSSFLGRVAVEDFEMVGLTEQYDRSVALFGSIFGKKLPPQLGRINVNPERRGDFYEISPALRRAVERHSAGDVELYRRACELFARLVAKFNA
jgi:hypothetical protein